jgi:hypothetical protein
VDVEYQEPFFSNPVDVPNKPFIYGGRAIHPQGSLSLKPMNGYEIQTELEMNLPTLWTIAKPPPSKSRILMSSKLK